MRENDLINCFHISRSGITSGMQQAGGGQGGPAPPVFGRLEGAAGQRRRAALLHAPPRFSDLATCLNWDLENYKNNLGKHKFKIVTLHVSSLKEFKIGQIFHCEHFRSSKTERAQKVIVVELAPYSQKSLLCPPPPPTALYWKNLSFDHGVICPKE